jgi:hypothetical protein
MLPETERGKLLAAVAKPEFVISDLRNEDLRRELFGKDPAEAKEERRRSVAVSRKRGMLRARGILEKVSKGHRSRGTSKGRQVLSVLLAAANATTNELIKLAAYNASRKTRNRAIVVREAS